MTQLILASASPRRTELFNQVGLNFEVIPSTIDEEQFYHLPGEERTLVLAREKAQSVGSQLDAGLVIGADTVVMLDGDLLEKPKDEEDAYRMLSLLSGSHHQVVTGVALLDASNGSGIARKKVTEVFFRELTDREIRAYIHTGEPMDKAGAYGIQGKGALFVEKIDGCYFNVMGLPLSLLGEMLFEFGIEVLA